MHMCMKGMQILHCTVLRKNVLSSNLQTCYFVVDPDHHILAWLMKVMHDDRKCILSVMICKPVITVQDTCIKKIDQVLS